MDSVWNGGDFEDFLKKDQPNPDLSNGDAVNQLNFCSIINDLIPNEQYPYHISFNDNLAELSQDETEQMLEDAISLESATSPFTDAYSSSNISTQNSPGTLSGGEEHYYAGGMPYGVKQEDLSPRNAHVNLIDNAIDNFLQKQQVADVVPAMDNIDMTSSDLPIFVQPQVDSSPADDGYSSYLQHQEAASVATNVCYSFDNSKVTHVASQYNTGKPVLKDMLQEASTKGIEPQNQPQQILELLQRPSKNERHKNSKHGKERTPGQSRLHKAKRQRVEQMKQKSDSRLESKSALETPLKIDSQAGSPETSQAFSQVVMIPQVVFTNGNVQNVTTQSAVTAYLASTNKSVMTALPIKFVSTNRSEMDKIPIPPIAKKHGDISGGKRGEKVERKTNHNEVEKRYRKSITSSLEDLKDLVFGTETKSTKAGILKKAMEHIRHLRKINQRLKQENMNLKMSQNQTSLMDLVKDNHNVQNVVETSTDDFTGSYTSEDDDLDMSEDDAQSVDVKEEVSSSESVGSVESVQGSTFSIRNKQRCFLSMFMFVFMFIGPSKFLFGTDKTGPSVDYSSAHNGGRTILAVNTSTEGDSFGGYSKFIVNSVLYLVFFAWLLIKGEPRYPRGCKQLSLYKTYLKKADKEIKQGDFTAASLYIERGLQVIGRPLSLSRLDMIVSLFWHSMCHILHQLGILSLLKNLGWLLLPRRLSLTEAVQKYRSSCAMAAEAYSKLLDLTLLDAEKRTNALLCAKVSMASINMAENAEGLADLELLTKTYVNSAVLLRTKMGRLAKPFMHYFLSRTNSALSQRAGDVPHALTWLFHPAGQAFMLSNDWVLSPANIEMSFKGDPLRIIGHQFLMHQVKKTLQHIIAPACSGTSLQETETELSLLKQCASKTDAMAKWWHSVLTAVFCIQHGMKQKAEKAWTSTYDFLPESNALACDLYDIVDCYFTIQDGLETEDVEARLQMAEDILLRNFLFEQGKEQKDELFQLLACACAETALIVRVEDWETSATSNFSTEKLAKFEQDLNILKELSSCQPLLSHKVEHYSKVLRVMVGSNPIHLTKQLLTKKSSSKARNNGSDEIQEAKTLLFFYKHLSTFISTYCPHGYISRLQNAGLALEKCGLAEMTEDCKKILLTLQTR